MHYDLFSLTWCVAFDDLLESLSILLPDLLFLSAEADILLDCLGQTKRSLALCCSMEKSLLLIFNKGIENLLELCTIAVSIKRKSWERNYSLSEKTCLKP